MNDQFEIEELWSLKIMARDLYNIERWPSDRPATGGGHTYIQVPKGLVADLLTFLHADYPPNGTPIVLEIHNRAQPGLPVERLELCSKSAGRMRIARQNRHGQNRLQAWTPEMGFPRLEQYQGTDVAEKLLDSIGGCHIYFARDSNGTVWADFTKGNPSKEGSKQPFANILWGESRGGYWRYEED